MRKTTTDHHHADGSVTRKVTRERSDGSSSTIVQKGSKDFFGIFSGETALEIKTDKNGNTYEKWR